MWTTYDPGDNGVGTDPDGFAGAVFDGRYIYFTPFNNGSSGSVPAEFLRFDTMGPFTASASWSTFTPSDHGLGGPVFAYIGGTFDGRYVYFAPLARVSCDYEGEVLRYDTLGTFTDPSAWAEYDAADDGAALDGGFGGAAFDGRYVYLAPWDNACNGGYFAQVRRYDTQLPFASPTSWEAYAPPGADGGYGKALVAGGYVYFSPHADGTHGEVLRFQTGGAFADPGSWQMFDPGNNGVGTDPDGYNGMAFDGRYVYFSPSYNGTAYHGEVLRYDTLNAFTDSGSWTTFDATTVHANAKGFYGQASFDGRFVYFPPLSTGPGNSSNRAVTRYNTNLTFTDSDAWSVFEPDALGGYEGCVFDGRFVYFVPRGDTPFHGQVLRFDAEEPPPIPSTSQWSVALGTLLLVTVGTLVLRGRRVVGASERGA